MIPERARPGQKASAAIGYTLSQDLWGLRLGLRVEVRIKGLGVQGLGFRGLGFRIKGLGVQGLGFRLRA